MSTDEERRREAEQREAQRAVQRSLDRRDRGGDAAQAASTAWPVASVAR
ncbi:MAG: hypothetical protein M3O55_09075 [Actinomycetota bacterium]|nr:hypothetical protein [Actinomycetota bacterium]